MDSAERSDEFFMSFRGACVDAIGQFTRTGQHASLNWKILRVAHRVGSYSEHNRSL